MIDMNKFYTERCMGESVLNKRGYEEASANQRAMNRVTQDGVDQLYRTFTRPSTNNLANNQGLQPQLPQPAASQLAQVFAQPLATLRNALANLFGLTRPDMAAAQAQNPMFAAMLQQPKLTERIASFFANLFVGNRKEDKDLKDEEEKNFQRFLFETDLLGKPIIQSSEGSQMGGGQSQ